MTYKNLATKVPFVGPPQPAEAAFEPLGVVGGLKLIVHPVDPRSQDPSVDDPQGLGIRMRAMEQHSLGFISQTAIEEAEQAPDSNRRLLELVVQASNFLPASFLEVGVKRATAICKIETSGIDIFGNEDRWAGTGFMVSPNILLTNHHVLNSVQVANNAVALFNFQDDPDGQPLTVKTFRLNPLKLFVTSDATKGLDFTFVFVDGEPGKEFGYIPLDRAKFKIEKGEFANIVQHPNGNKKIVVLQQNEVTFQDDVVVHYASDTEVGSSGSCVFNNSWSPIALHHAGRDSTAGDAAQGSGFINEGIKLSAIAAYLEQLAEEEGGNTDAATLVSLFRGSDAKMGFFGALGREKTSPTTGTGFETVVTSYKGEADDVDVGFWNIEWFNRDYEQKLDDVARIILDMNLDIWAFEENSPEATAALVDHLDKAYHQKFEYAASEPNAPGNLQTTTVMWRSKTVQGQREAWPEEIDSWFSIDSRQFGNLQLEAVNGKVFPRYPALYHFTAQREEGGPFDFYLVPLHLKAMSEGSKRRRMASKILAVAINKMIEAGKDSDWIVGGDFNAELATKDFAALIKGGLVPASAADEQSGAITYLDSPNSLIDHIFLSGNLGTTFGSGDYFIVANDRRIPDYIERISDHRPVLMRLSLKKGTSRQEMAGMAGPMTATIPKALQFILEEELVS